MIVGRARAEIAGRAIGVGHARCTVIATALAVIFVSSLAAAGCRRSDMAPVSGRVTFEGRPVPKAIVRFMPESRPMAAAGTDDDGRYRLTTRRPMDGASIGRHKVIVTPWMPGAGDTSGVTAEPVRPDIPKVFRNAATSPLAVEVTPKGPNQFDFELAKQAAAKR
jgi:hypothetical protein